MVRVETVLFYPVSDEKSVILEDVEVLLVVNQFMKENIVCVEQ